MKNLFLLDMDDTLLDFQKLERENILDTLQKFGLRADDYVAKRFHEINDGLWKALERGEIKRGQIVTKRFELLLQELGQTADIQAIADYYFEGLAEKYYPFDGMEEFLQELSRRGEVYILTNGAEYVQRRHLKDANILPYVKGVFISDCIGHNKPSEEYVAYAQAHIENFQRERAVYLGDSLTSDKRCAERLGVDFVLFVPRTLPNGYEGRFVRDFDEALKVFEKI